MAYSRIKVWIAAEVLTASDLNAEHTGHIANENDLDTRLVAEIATRTTLESEHDTLQANLWNAGDSQVADNRVGQASMKDNAIHTAELKSGAVTEVKCATAIKDAAVGVYSLRRIGTTGLKACAGNDARLGMPDDSSVTSAKFFTPTAGNNIVGRHDIETTSTVNTYTLKKSFTILQAGIYRIKFDLKNTGGGGQPAVLGKIYRNQIAIGVEQSDSTGSYVTKSQDISGWSVGDTCELWLKISSGTGYAQNFRLSVATVCMGVPIAN